MSPRTNHSLVAMYPFPPNVLLQTGLAGYICGMSCPRLYTSFYCVDVLHNLDTILYSPCTVAPSGGAVEPLFLMYCTSHLVKVCDVHREMLQTDFSATEAVPPIILVCCIVASRARPKVSNCSSVMLASLSPVSRILGE